MAESKLSILIRAIGAAKAAKELKGVDAVISKIGARTGKGLRKAGDNLGRIGLLAGGAAVGGLAAAVKVAGDFEAQLNTINTIAQATPTELAAIGQGIRDMAKKSGASLDDLTTAYYDLLSAGIATADAQNVLNQANTLAVGGLATTAETVDLLTTAINAYGGDASKAAQYTDDFAKAIEVGKVTAADIAASFADVGAIAAQSGVSVREIAASYGYLTKQGVPAAEVTTQMGRAILELLKPSATLEKLQKKTGKTYAELARTKGLVPTLQAMRTDAEKAKIPLVELFGRVEGYKYLLETTGAQNAGFNDVMRQMGDDAGTAARQMSARQQGLNFQISRLKALAIDAGITIGNKLLPKLTTLAERAVKFLNANQANIGKFGDKVAAAFDKALAFAQKIPWDQVGAGLKTAADWAGKLFDAFLKLPPEFQSTLIALAGLNKLSGGAITGVVGELGKGLIKGVLGMNAGVVNINAGVVNGAGGVPGGNAGGGNALASIIPVIGGLAIFQSIGEIIRSAIGLPSTPQDTVRALGGSVDTPKINVVPGSTTGWRELNLSRPALLALQAQQAATDKVYDSIEKLRGALSPKLDAATYASQQEAAAIRDKNFSPVINVSPRIAITNNVSVRSINQQTKVVSRLGFVAS